MRSPRRAWRALHGLERENPPEKNVLTLPSFDLRCKQGSSGGDPLFETPSRLIQTKNEASRRQNGAPGGIRTLDLRIRSPLLYPAELQAHRIVFTEKRAFGSEWASSHP